MELNLSVTIAFALCVFLASGNVNEICSQEKEIGNCLSQVHRYYFDAESGSCERFMYTGCDGNDNNFVSRFECERTCPGEHFWDYVDRQIRRLDNSQTIADLRDAIMATWYNMPPATFRGLVRVHASPRGGGTGDLDLGDICSLESETGMCRAYFRHYFFNASSGMCEQFVYGGCGGNHNNFRTMEECESYCG